MSARKGLYAALDEAGLLEYGSVIQGSFVRRALGLEGSANSVVGGADFAAIKRAIGVIELKVLAAVDVVKEELLNHGKYIASVGDDYRILTPAENAGQVMAYHRQAKSKLRRAEKLNKTSPAMSDGKPDQAAALLAAESRSLRDAMRAAKLMGGASQPRARESIAATA